MKHTLLSLLISTLLISGCSKQQVEQQQEPKTEKPIELNTTPQGEYKSLGMNPQEFQEKFNHLTKLIGGTNIISNIQQHSRTSNALYGDALFMTKVNDTAIAGTLNEDNTLNSLLMVVKRPSNSNEEKTILTTIYVASTTVDTPKGTEASKERGQTIKSLLIYAINNPHKPITKEINDLYKYEVVYDKNANVITFNIYKK